MKKLSLFILGLLVLISCSQDTQIEDYDSFRIEGSVTKGSFLSGATIVFTELDDRDLAQKGSYYVASIYDSSGTYDLNIDREREDVVRATASGYFWDEVRNQVSDGELDLSGLFEWSSELNINVLSQLESERVKYLIQNDMIGGSRSKRFGKAKKQALNEVLSVFGIDEEFERSEEFSFLDGDKKSKVLLAISAALQADRDTYAVASLLAEMTADIREDGTLDDESLRETIGSRLCILDIDKIAENVVVQLAEDFPNLTENSLVSDYLDDIKAEFSGYECDTKVNPGSNVISIGMITKAIDDNCDELTFFTDLDNDGELDANETVINTITICDGTDGEDGEDGEDGISVKVYTTRATDCNNGGTTFIFYLDTNDNDMKDDDEMIVTETTICNGGDGADADPLGVQITEASTEECPAGGKKITIFRDSNANGTLEDTETVLDTAVVCDGRSDLDGDGVPDDIDECLNTPANTTVNEQGCAYLSLDENGITVKAADFVQTGESYTLSGKKYEVVDEDTLRDKVVSFEENDLSAIVTSKITNFEGLFWFNAANDTDLSKTYDQYQGLNSDHFSSFNQDISSWDTSQVTSFFRMFRDNLNFNQPIGVWNTSLVTNMNCVLDNARAFNKPLNDWDTSKVTTMANTFKNARKFNQPLNNWNTSSVTNMSKMFFKAFVFNQNLSSWDVNKVTTCDGFIRNANNWELDKPNFSNCSY